MKIIANQPYMLPKNAGVTAVWFPLWEGRYITKAAAEQTEGRLLQFLINEPRGAAPPLHIHRDADETWYIINGQLTVFVGDQHQHHAIEAGRPIHQMQQAGMPVARLDTIRRQRDPMLREAVELAAKGEIDRALTLLKKHNRIREIQNTDVRYKSIAHEYVAAHEAGERVLVVSPANDERRQLNSAIRELLMRRYHISAEGKEQIIFVNRDLTTAQRLRAQSDQGGDVVRYRRGSLRLGLGKGTYARIEGTDPDLNRITVRTEDGRAVEYNPARLTGVDHPNSLRMGLGQPFIGRRDTLEEVVMFALESVNRRVPRSLERSARQGLPHRAVAHGAR